MMAQPQAKAVPWSFPVRREDVPESGLHLALTADEPTRAAVAAVAGLRALPRLEARFDVVRQGSGLHVTGEVSATIEQACVVTLEPIVSELREPIDLTFVPPSEGTAETATVDDEEPIDPEAADDPEPLVNGVADLGAAATEFLLLGIDPYPRKSDAVFEAPPQPADPADHPFAALAALKKDPSPQ
jgi:uncharacterized protein DUF177 involved in 23S rRNA accumulation